MKPIVLVHERNVVQPADVPRVDRLRFTQKDRSKVLYTQVAEHNKAMSGRGLKYLRSFLSRVVRLPGYAAAKPLLDAVNGENPFSATQVAKQLLTQVHETAAEQFAVSQIALSVKKFPFVGLPAIARANGLKVLMDGERRNRHLNALQRARRKQGSYDPFLHGIRVYVHRLLGDTPDFRKWPTYAGWGPGACVGVHGRFTHFAAKILADEWTVTARAIPYALTIAKRLPVFWEALGLAYDVPVHRDGVGLGQEKFLCLDADEFTRRFHARVKVVEYNKVAFVPKDADKDRVIASEPLLNQLCQKAADEEMRLHLRRFGIDLRNQDVNKEWAREGSCFGSNPRCTIDLSNASGSIFTELVREVTAYCPDWFDCLNDIRSKSYVMPDDKTLTPKRYEMFSSMGNGTTFPLETIIFAAICSAAHDYCGTTPDFRCYGDDIVVRQNEALVVLEILRRYGFKANADKTFITGRFRESCGADWYDGVAVRPVVLDTCLDTLEMRIRIHNAFTRLPNATDAAALSQCCCDWFPPFAAAFVRPFADHTDEAIDGRFLSGPPAPSALKCLNFDAPAWYGISLSARADEDIVTRPGFPVALHYAALLGASSVTPFAARRETRLRVARFSHSGNTSSWVPALPRLHSQPRRVDRYHGILMSAHVGAFLGYVRRGTHPVV